MYCFVKNILVISAVFFTVAHGNINGNETNEFENVTAVNFSIQFELIKPDTIPVFHEDNGTVKTDRGVIGCSLFCLRITSINCTGFALFPGNKSCVALADDIDGELGGRSPDYIVYRKKRDDVDGVTTMASVYTTRPVTLQMSDSLTTTLDPCPSPSSAISWELSQLHCIIYVLINYPGNEAKTTCESDGGHLSYVTTLAQIADYKSILGTVIPNINPSYDYKIYMGVRRATTVKPWIYDYNGQILNTTTALWETGFPTNDPLKDCVLIQKSTRLVNDYCDYYVFGLCEIVL